MPRRISYTPRRSRRATVALTVMLLSILMLLAGVGMEAFNRKRAEPMATISLTCSTVGLVGGVTGYVIRRTD